MNSQSNNPSLKKNLLLPDWPAPATVKAYSSTRLGGVSQAPYDSLNLGEHVGDEPQAVAQNRQLLQTALSLPNSPVWLKQVHGQRVIELPAQLNSEADAAFTRQTQQVCAVMTADCMPVLFCHRQGDCVAVAHAGWRGLAAGVLEATLQAAQFEVAQTLVWLGPAIGRQAFEVGDEVRQAFMAHSPQAAQAFVGVPNKPGHWLADLYLLAKQRLQQAGVTQIFGGHFCTYQDKTRFFSYRRDRVSGRMASLIYLTAQD